MCILVPLGIVAIFVIVSRSTGHEGIDLSDPMNVALVGALLVGVTAILASPHLVKCPHCKRCCRRVNSKDAVLVECPECKTQWSLAPISNE